MCETVKDIDQYLVIDSKLYEAFKNQESETEVIHLLDDHIIRCDLFGGFKKFKSTIRKFIYQYSNTNDILHFVGDHPLIPFLKRRQVYSITQSSLKNLNFFGRVGQLAGVIMSDKIDILDPIIFNRFHNFFFYKRKNIYRTSNSYCDVELFSTLSFEQKKDWLVFLGRFESMKQVKELLGMV